MIAVHSSSMLKPISGIGIRRATPEDAEACGHICYDAFTTINRQHNFPPELPAPDAAIVVLSRLFSHPGFFCVVAELNGRIVGSNCLDERSTIAGVGPVTVEPNTQNRSIGRMLMRAVMDRARERDFPGVRLLQATFHSRSLCLYTKLGFDPRELMVVMHGSPIKQVIKGCKVRSATEADLDAANRVCESVHGHNRTGELREAIAQGTAVVVERDHEITGYASEFGYRGHAVAASNLDLKALLASMKDFPRPGVIVPTRNVDLFRWCLENNLRVFQPMTLMTIGLYNEPRGAYLPSVLF
jgi:predicted N-acetyltransferase YhbS